MRREIGWLEKMEDGVKCEVRAAFPGRGQIVWRFKRYDAENWDRRTTPTLEQWHTLLERVEAFYVRRRAPHEDLELVRKTVKALENETGHQ